MSVFSVEELARLSAQMDAQRQELLTEEMAVSKSLLPSAPTRLLHKQMETIAQVTQEPPKPFLRKLHLAVKDDLYHEDGVLYKQWKKWGDLSNQDVLEKFGIALTTLGLSGNGLGMVAVAAGVITLHLGAKVFCEEFGDEG